MKRKEKLIGLFMVLFAMISVNAWGESDAYYAKATVKGNTGLGKVYVSNAKTSNPEYSTSGESTAIGSASAAIGNSTNITFYLYAQPNNPEDYEFMGWSESEDGNVINNSAVPEYTRTINSNSKDSNNPVGKTWYAKFAQKLIYYTKLNAVGGVGGSVNITSTSNITTEAIENGMSASSVTKQVNAPRISYTLAATPESGYQFSGWYRDAALSTRASQNASYSVNIDGKTDVAEATQTYYAKFEQLHDYYKHVYAKAIGNGLVYLGTSRNPNASAYNTVFDIPNHVYQVNAPGNTTYYWIAKEVDGYNFKGWYDNEACEGNPVSTSTSYNKQISASVDEDVVNALYAKFVPYDTYYSSVTVKAQEGGVVFVGNGETELDMKEYGVEKTFSQGSVSKSAPNHSYTLYAQANPGYEFKGWVYNNGNPSTNNTVSFAANSINEAEPTSRTYTAVFAEKDIIWNWAKPTLAAGNYYIYNPTADKFLGNANNGVDAEDATLWTLTDNSGTWKISEGENHVYVDRTGGSVDWSLNPQLDPQKFTAYSSGSKATSETCSDVFWVKGNGEYTFNTYLKFFNAAFDNNDRSGDVYIGLNGVNMSTATERNAQKWYFVTEAEMEAYKEYVAAYNRAVDIVAEIPEWGETKNTLNDVINNNVPSDLTNHDTNIAALNKIQKANMTISSAAQYGTFVAPFEVKIPGGVIAYAIESTTGTTEKDGIVTFSPVEGETLAACTPVVVNKAGGLASTTFYGLATTTEEEVTGNGLVGVLVDGKYAPENSYVINYIDGKVAFYIVKSEISVPKNRCYLESGASLAKLNIIFNDATSISSTNTTETSISAIYSASGARINTLQKGVNIIKMSDGSVKKVLVK